MHVVDIENPEDSSKKDCLVSNIGVDAARTPPSTFEHKKVEKTMKKQKRSHKFDPLTKA